MTPGGLADVISAVVRHSASADAARKLTSTLSEDSMDHGWEALAEGYAVAHGRLEEATAELRTLAAGLRRTAPLWSRISKNRSSPDESKDLDEMADELATAATILDAVGRNIDETVLLAEMVGARHLSQRLHELLEELQHTDEELSALKTEIDTELEAAAARTGAPSGEPEPAEDGPEGEGPGGDLRPDD
ncbi:hypothetical protein [Kineosporia babensis]|uniref:Uncharacterized protein n=1 Tax=Kineosporia babensis TaxID=499548 RepID=A0A9X1NGT0_9ACTN|nr:hypothetical protein [Kineosporia babensis]MCD5313605.1 hypothetical protein [Kineosporia babensis]